MQSTLRALADASGAIVLLAYLGTAQATYTTYRQSCPSSVGTPQLSAGAPILGSTWTLTVTGLRPSAVGSVFFALRDDRLGAFTLPLDLALLGAPGCYLNVNSDPAAGGAAASFPADAAGRASASLAVPNNAALVGARFYNQYISLDAPAGRALPVTTTNAGRGVIGLLGVPDMILIPSGSFAMGSTQGQPDEQPVHTVHITRPFWIGKYEVTQAEWQALMGTNPARFPGAARPVEQVNWNEAMAYCAALDTRERNAGRLPAGYEYRLPTEAEWEYCCRAGTTTEWSVGSSLGCAEANHNNCIGQTTDVGSYPANAWGLFDMHGNVWEMCLDAWDGSANYPAAAVTDPFVGVGAYRISRGGGWNSWATSCRSARRSPGTPESRMNITGFRIVLAQIVL